LPGATEELKTVIDIEPSHAGAIVDLMELYLLLNKIDDFDDLYKRNKTIVESRGGERGVKYYFDILREYQLKKYDDVRRLVERYIEPLPFGKEKRIQWDFSDVRTYLKSNPSDTGRNLLELFIKLASGDISTEEAKVQI